MHFSLLTLASLVPFYCNCLVLQKPDGARTGITVEIVQVEAQADPPSIFSSISNSRAHKGLYVEGAQRLTRLNNNKILVEFEDDDPIHGDSGFNKVCTGLPPGESCDDCLCEQLSGTLTCLPSVPAVCRSKCKCVAKPEPTSA